jgi:hypothetical protein
VTEIRATRGLDEHQLVAGVLARMATDLSMIVDRDFVVQGTRVERCAYRPAGAGVVHISFKLGIEVAGESRQGCLLVPLPDAVALAGFMMLLPDEVVAQERLRTDLDGPFKEALLQVGKFLAGACDSVLRMALPVESATRSDGCQGVRAHVRPALAHSEGDALLVGRASARVHDFEPFELILTLPSVADMAAAESVSG